jgi:hypothetical protein
MYLTSKKKSCLAENPFMFDNHHDYEEAHILAKFKF